MDLRQQNIIKFSSEILDYLLKFRAKNPDFTFSLRQRDSTQTKDIKRLETGQWFQGSDYIYIPLFKKGDNARKIKTIGFIIDFDKVGNITKNSIVISFKAGTTDVKEISFHRQLANKFDIFLNENNHGEKLFDNINDINTNLEFYLNEFRNQALALIEEFGINNNYIISKEEFDKNLNRIENIKKQNSINYWVFQGNPKVFDFETALREEILTDWTVSAHKEKIKIGDKVILYIGGKNAGCYALAEITSEPHVKKYSADNHLWKDIDKNELKAGINITHNLVSNPIYKSLIDSHESLKNLKVGSQGTNFSATKEEYETLVNLSGLNFRDLNNETKINPMALNTILYGPPGTGKTYNSINKAIEIINPSFNLKQDRKIVKSEYDRLVNEGQIVFTTFHQSMSYEDFIEGIKPKVEEDVHENKQVVYEIEDGIFKRLVNKAKTTNTSMNSNASQYGFDEAWDDLITEAEQNIEKGTPETLKIQTPNLGLKIIEITERGNLRLKPIYSEDAKEYTVSYSRVKRLHEVFPDLSKVKNIDKEFRAVIGGSNSTAYWSILNILNPKIIANSNNINNTKELTSTPFVLIIDEINRGNISSIFGELITLIEDSKRLGQMEELEVLLPYSKTKFGVPSNLYIIGTMNTADRSVEALDTALRRRFSFVEMMPDEKVIADKKFTGYDRVTIMNLINQRIEVLLDRNYTLGHSYFIKDDFQNSFENEIIPLLQEYFYNDYGKIGLVLGKGFVREKAITAKNDKSIFADFDTKNEVDITKSYELIPFTEINFETAIQTLLA